MTGLCGQADCAVPVDHLHRPRSLSLRQPWASLIANGTKTIETRGWSTKYRGPLLIHAGLKVEPGRVGRWTVWNESGWVWWLDGRDGDPESSDYDALPLGAVVATCTLVDVVPMVEREWLPGGFIGTRQNVLAILPADHPAAPAIHLWMGGEFDGDVSDQRPYGDFTPGRYAWLLADVHPLTSPVPAKGRQGLWTPDDDLTLAVEADAGRGL